MKCTNRNHDDDIEEFGCCDTCGKWAEGTSLQERTGLTPTDQLDGYDRNGATDGWNVYSDADSGL